MWILILLALVLGLLAYVRLAPTYAEQVHCAIDSAEDADGEGHCVRVLDADEAALAKIDAAMMALPRTTRIAGSVETGRITYITRSKWIGFPDYTTVQRDGDRIKLFGRLRFGRSDFGVNRVRLDHVVAALRG